MAILRALGSSTQAEIVAGGNTIDLIITEQTDQNSLQAGDDDLTYETWDTVTWKNPLPDLSGITSGSLGAGAGFWDTEMSLSSTDFTRIDDHTVRLTLPAAAGYSTVSDEVITFAVDGTMVNTPANGIGTFTDARYVIRTGTESVHSGTINISSKTVWDTTGGVGIHTIAAGSTVNLLGRPLVIEDVTLRIRGTRANPTRINFLNASGLPLTAAEQDTISGNAGAVSIHHVPQAASAIPDELSATGLWMIGAEQADWVGEEITPNTIDGTTASDWVLPGDTVVRWNFGALKYQFSNADVLTSAYTGPPLDPQFPWPELNKEFIDSPDFGVTYAPIANYTRTITFDGFGHIQFAGHASKTSFPATIRWVALGDSSNKIVEHRIAPDPTSFGRTARYPLHWHHVGEDSVGSWIEGVSGWGSKNHFFVTHSSHGIYFYRCTTAWTIAENDEIIGGTREENNALATKGLEHWWWDPGIAFGLNGTQASGQPDVVVKTSVQSPFNNPAATAADRFHPNTIVFLSQNQGDTGAFYTASSTTNNTITLTENLNEEWAGGAVLENTTRDIRFNNCFAHGIAKFPGSISGYTTGEHVRDGVVFLGTGNNGTCGITDNCYVGYNQMGKDAASFHWPENSNSLPNVWIFNDVICHNNYGPGIFIWQNTGTDPHNNFNVQIIHCGVDSDAGGLDQGAYVTKGYHNGGDDETYHKFEIFGTTPGIDVHSVSQGISRGDGYGVSYEKIKVTGLSTGYSIKFNKHSLPPSRPTLFLKCNLDVQTNGKPIWWADGPEAASKPGHYDIVECGLDHGNPAGNFYFQPNRQSNDTVKMVTTTNIVAGGTSVTVADTTGFDISKHDRVLFGGEYVDVLSVSGNMLTLNNVGESHAAGEWIWAASFVRMQELAENSQAQSYAIATDGETKAIADFYYPVSTDDVGLVTPPSVVNTQIIPKSQNLTAHNFTLNFTPTDDNYLVIAVASSVKQSDAPAHAGAPTISGGSLTYTRHGSAQSAQNDENQISVFGAEVSGTPGAFTGTVTLSTASPIVIGILEVSNVEDADPTGAFSGEIHQNDNGSEGSIKNTFSAEITGIERKNSLLVAFGSWNGLPPQEDGPVDWTFHRTGQASAAGESVGLIFSSRVNSLPPFRNWDWDAGGDTFKGFARSAAIEVKGIASTAPTGQSQVPGVPTAVEVTPLLEGCTITWTAPSDVGSSALVRYEIHPIPNLQLDGVTTIPVGIVDGATTTYTFPQGSLDGGRQYSFTVYAVNNAGAGLGAGSFTIDITKDHLGFGRALRIGKKKS